ncbi:MAG TPA: glycosyltransferase family 1 protein [Pyrinomonadaceae bacterium]|jgi:glycosyltransferase involved in cell wall biosynthesis|nr:glycosyltransferase family 1 protein [Pyrinomonadaceae bacterium]
MRDEREGGRRNAERGSKTVQRSAFIPHRLTSSLIPSPSLRIAIDAHSVGTGLAGNESYSTNLIEALAELDTTNRYTLYVTKREAVERFQNRWPHVTVRMTLPHTPLVRIPLTLARELRRRPVDLLHVQYTAPPFAPCPVVATIHDLSFEHLPQTFKRRSRMQLRLTVRRTARAAAHILVPSEHTRRDIIETYNVRAERVSVTKLAAPEYFAPVEDEREVRRVRELYKIRGDYILAVGSIQPRKNLARLIKAYSALRRARPQANLPQLALVGKRAWLYDETLRAIEESGIKDLTVLTGYVSESDLPALYTGALCFVYPSYFEGFGLPPLEAMQCGTPVIAGNRTSLPEVVGDAGLLVDPFDEDALAQALARMIDDSDFRAGLRVKGLERARNFSWRETARLTLQAYKRAIGGREWKG